MTAQSKIDTEVDAMYGKFDGCSWEGKPFRDMTKLELMEALLRMIKSNKSEMEAHEFTLKLLGSGLR